MDVHFDYTPMTVHLPFHQSLAKERAAIGAVGSGKALALDTPILTVDGWETMGTLTVGDRVFDERGRVTNVTGVFDVSPTTAYRVIFDTGEPIHACGDHLWTVTSRRSRNRWGRSGGTTKLGHAPDWPSWATSDRYGTPLMPIAETLSTSALAESFATATDAMGDMWGIPTTAPLMLPEAPLPIDPYILGYWLGDGFSSGGRFSIGDHDVEHAEIMLGHDFRSLAGPTTYGTTGLQVKLRGLGVLGDKHVPDSYLFASASQRLALLQGLMDSDGSATTDRVSVEFSNSNEALSRGVYDLAVSLGQKPTITLSETWAGGVRHQDRWRVRWRPTRHVVPFRLPRKAQRVNVDRPSPYSIRSQTHYIRAVEPAELVPMRCIQVDSPNHLYLAGRSLVPTHNTIALCGDAILRGLQQPGSKILICRQTVPALRDTTMAEFMSLLQRVPEELDTGAAVKTLWDLCEFSKSTNTITFPNGSEFLFRPLDDWKKHMSLNLAYLYVDEASEIDLESWIGLGTRVRQEDALPGAHRLGFRKIRSRGMALCTNPNGHDWIWERFVRPYELAKDGDPASVAWVKDHRYFRSTSFDNPFLPDDYMQTLLSMPMTWLKRYVMCTFDAFGGQIYPFNPDVHLVEHFTPPADWDRAMGLDWGLRNPTAVVWWARRPGTPNWVQYREWQTYDPMDPTARESYQTMDADQVVARIKQIEHAAGEKRILYRVADPAVQQRSQVSGKSVAHHFSMAGMSLQFGMKRYEDRINALTRMLTNGTLKFSRNCPMTTIAIQQYRWADTMVKNTDGSEKPVKKNDHLVNAAEYLATHFMAAPSIERPKPPPTFSDEVWASVKKQVNKGLRRH